MNETDALDFHPSFLEKDGVRQFAVLPYEEFVRLQELVEDARDLLELRQAKEAEKGTPAIPLDEWIKCRGQG